MINTLESERGICMMSIFVAIFVAILWAIGEVYMTKDSVSQNRKVLIFYQYLGMAILYFGTVLLFSSQTFLTFSWYHFFRMMPVALANIIGMVFYTKAIQKGKLSVVSPVMAAYPIINVFLGFFILKEDVGFLSFLAAICIALAIVWMSFLQTKGSSKGKTLNIGLLAAVIYMIIVAFATYLEKWAYVDGFTIMDCFYYFGICYFLSSVGVYVYLRIHKIPLYKITKDTLLGIGGTDFGNLLSSVALHGSSMSLVTPIMAMYTILTNFLSRSILKEKISFWQSLCITIIILCTLLILIL